MTQQAIRLESTDRGIWIHSGDRRVGFYQRETAQRGDAPPCSNYLHPINDLDGNPLTEDFPSDHLHHRGIFWAWHQLTVDGNTIGDGWMLRRFTWDVRECEPSSLDDGAAMLRLVVDWKSPDFRNGQLPVVTEQTRLTFFPDSDDRRQFDIDIRLRATHPNTRIGGSDDAKGYGGFSLRTKLPDDLAFVSQNGPEQPAFASVPPSPWMSFRGSFSEQSDHSITVLTHPQSVGYPQPWILRSARSMQNPVWPGPDAVMLPEHSDVRLRYRVLIHRKSGSAEMIDRWQQSYIAAPDTAV
ncbi:DUF6807 family protein [Roseiconus lacunae]|uniref:DUF6807 family protein n=1 Tax=Roseiconus lacunae TaxID=2605694 RepID=UPI0011F24AD2|nr:DUF6807 family protein [Roseiconus lacunae]